ncbi:MAG: hypothetical protein KGZ97_12085 [Bacteroidetes bacterium]|nr:hypothetical protein [Bacteroidota bacterium]
MYREPVRNRLFTLDEREITERVILGKTKTFNSAIEAQKHARTIGSYYYPVLKLVYNQETLKNEFASGGWAVPN